MPTLAPKLPWTHPFAGGYPRLGGQPLPSDPDAIDYLNRVAAADGAAVEVGVAMAVDDFIKGLKADSLWDAIGSSCLLCGPRTLAGALVPLRGDAPTSYGFVEGDYDREGLTGDGTSYLDSNRANDAAPQNDFHLSAYQTAPPTTTVTIAGMTKSTATQVYTNIVLSGTNAYIRANNDTSALAAISGGQSVGLFAATRSSSSEYYAKTGSTSPSLVSTASAPPSSLNLFVFANNADGVAGFIYNGTLAFYSIGTSLDLAKLDSHITAYVTAIGAAI